MNYPRRGPNLTLMSNKLKTKVYIPDGACASDTNPDAWFPEVVTNGPPSRRVYLPIALEAKRAIDICHKCPAKVECLEAGMEEVNLMFGIWGGTLPHERLNATGNTYTRYSDEGRVLHTMQSLQPFFEEAGIGNHDTKISDANGNTAGA